MRPMSAVFTNVALAPSKGVWDTLSRWVDRHIAYLLSCWQCGFKSPFTVHASWTDLMIELGSLELKPKALLILYFRLREASSLLYRERTWCFVFCFLFFLPVCDLCINMRRALVLFFCSFQYMTQNPRKQRQVTA